MFGWLKRRMLARKARKAVASVDQWRRQCRDMALSGHLKPGGVYLLVGSDVDTIRLQAELQKLTDRPVMRAPGR